MAASHSWRSGDPACGGVVVTGRLEQFASMSVLVVDDNVSNVLLLTRLLQQEGINRVSTETDSRKVAGLLASVDPDLVLLDLHMPHLDGHSVLMQVKQFAGASYLPVLVLTADSSSAARDAALSNGAQDFLTKPFDTTEAVLRIANLLETRSLHSAVRQLAGNDEETGTLSSDSRNAVLAVERDQSIMPVFQPVIGLRTGGIVGHEALSRFPTPHARGPAGWFSDAFAMGVGPDFEWQAITAAVPFLLESPPETFLAVNMSPATMLTMPDRELWDESLWSRIVLEVTEHVPIADYSAVHRALREFRERGGRLAADDLGAGYAGFRHLIALEPDIIKLDISLVKGIDRSHAARALTRALLAFAADVGAIVIGEGIETETEFAVLQDLGVPWGQGYFLGRPEPHVNGEVRAVQAALRTSPAPSTTGLATSTGGTTGAAVRSTVDDHVVLLVDDEDDWLLRHVTTYVDDGLFGDGRLLLITTGAHRERLLSSLPPRRLARAQEQLRVSILDAEQTLTRIMRSGSPDPGLFDAVIGGIVRAQLAGPGALTSYSEMSAILTNAGNPGGAVQLERLWNQLRGQSGFSLLCTCPAPPLSGRPRAERAEICDQHTSVLGLSEPAGTRLQTMQVALDSSRSLIRVESAEEAVGVLIRAVADLGGTTSPAHDASDVALDIDVSLGEGVPLLAVAPVGSTARRNLEQLLPGLVEDAKAAISRARRLVRLSSEVDTDPLTGLGNRRGLSRVRALDRSDAVAMLDLDHFKLVNDVEGHEAGDRVLVEFSRALRGHLRSTDTVFRLGGEEFLVILPATTPEDGLIALGNLRDRWKAERPLPVTFSAGVARVEGLDLTAALAAADAALYAAKQHGRDRFEVASTSTPITEDELR